MSPRVNNTVTELHKWITLIVIPFMSYQLWKIDTKVDYAYDAARSYQDSRQTIRNELDAIHIDLIAKNDKIGNNANRITVIETVLNLKN